jgi:hypothetical protein
VTIRRWKWICPDVGPALWAPTGNTMDIDIVTGICSDTSGLRPRLPAGGLPAGDPASGR